MIESWPNVHKQSSLEALFDLNATAKQEIAAAFTQRTSTLPIFIGKKLHIISKDFYANNIIPEKISDIEISYALLQAFKKGHIVIEDDKKSSLGKAKLIVAAAAKNSHEFLIFKKTFSTKPSLSSDASSPLSHLKKDEVTLDDESLDTDLATDFSSVENHEDDIFDYEEVSSEQLDLLEEKTIALVQKELELREKGEEEAKRKQLEEKRKLTESLHNQEALDSLSKNKHITTARKSEESYDPFNTVLLRAEKRFSEVLKQVIKSLEKAREEDRERKKEDNIKQEKAHRIRQDEYRKEDIKKEASKIEDRTNRSKTQKK